MAVWIIVPMLWNVFSCFCTLSAIASIQQSLHWLDFFKSFLLYFLLLTEVSRLVEFNFPICWLALISDCICLFLFTVLYCIYDIILTTYDWDISRKCRTQQFHRIQLLYNSTTHAWGPSPQKKMKYYEGDHIQYNTWCILYNIWFGEDH